MSSMRFVIVAAAATLLRAACAGVFPSCQNAFASELDRFGGLFGVDPDTLEKLSLQYLECRYDEDPFP